MMYISFLTVRISGDTCTFRSDDLNLCPAGHAALVVGVHGDVVCDSLGEAVDGSFTVADHLPMGMEIVGINASKDMPVNSKP